MPLAGESLLRLRESAESQPLTLEGPSLDQLGQLGRRLASQKSWWGEVDDERESSAIKAIPAPGGQWRIRVDNAVGVFSAGDLQVAIQPKIPLEHFLHLLSASGALPRLDESPTSIQSDETLWELVATWFVSASETLLRKGMVRDYQLVRDDLAVVRGRLAPRETATNFYRGRLRLDCEYEEFSFDTPLNRVILGAARVVSGSRDVGAGLRRRALALSIHMDEGVGDWVNSDLSVLLDRRTSHYRDALPLAKHVLRHAGRTLSHGPEMGWSFLFPTPGLVEEAIRRILARALAPWPVAKRARQLEGSSLTLNPDLVFGSTEAIGDVKYKLSGAAWNRADLYEVVAFATAFRTTEACVVSFADPEATRLPQLMVGDVRVSSLIWPAIEELTPKDAESAFIASAREWASQVRPADTLSRAS